MKKNKKKKRAARTGRGYAVHPNILRVDYDRTCGFNVRFYRTNPDGTRRVIGKYFADGVYGSRSKAFLAAMAWRNATEKRLPAPQRPGRVANPYPPGYSYIKRAVAHDYPRGGGPRRPYKAWIAFFRIEDRKHRLTKWSIEKWGDREAKRRCEAWLATQKQDLAKRLGTTKKKKRRKTR